MTDWAGFTTAWQTEALAALKEGHRRAVTPFQTCAETLLVVPLLTKQTASACGIPMLVLERLELDGFCRTRMNARWDPATGRVSDDVERDREYILHSTTRSGLLDLVLSDPQRGYEALRKAAAECGRALGTVLPGWASLARFAETPVELVVELDRRVSDSLSRGVSGEALRAIEEGRMLEEVMGSDVLSFGLTSAAQKLNDFHAANTNRTKAEQ